MNIEISEAKPEDAQGIQNVFYKTWLTTYPNKEHGITEDDIHDKFKDAFTDSNIEKIRNNIQSMRNSNTKKFLVAKYGDTVVGVCRIEIRDDFNELGAIYVLPEYQGKEIGSKMWLESHRYFNPNKDTIVHVASFNTKAIKFYEKLGFIKTGKTFTEKRMKSGAMIPEIEMIRKVK